HPYRQLNTSPDVFLAQMKWLKNMGYHSINLSEMLAGLLSGSDMSRSVVITFDDGYRDFLTNGYVALKQCGFTATVFLVTDRIRSTPTRFEGVDYLTWQEVRELHSQGIQFGSHTVTHPDLRSLDLDQIDYEVGCAKEVIEQELSTPIESFSYPFPFPEEDKNFARFLGDVLENNG